MRPPRLASPPPARLCAVAALLLLAGSVACRAKRPEKLTAEFFAMGGIPIHVTAWDVEQGEFERIVGEYRREVQRLEAAMSKHRTESVLSRLNAAGGAELPLDPETAELIREALRYVGETDGAFDPTVGPVLDLWKRAEREGRPPSDAALAEAQSRVGPSHVRVGSRGSAGTPVRLDPGTTLDLGGIAKGYFADVGVRLLRRHGIRRGLVELGGDLAAFDDRERAEPFRVGVRDPAQPDRALGVLRVDGGGVVTSGDYERGYEIGGVRYNHIVDPRTGRPTTGVHSVTLVAESGTRADALATGVLVLGAEAGPALVARLPDVEAILVGDDPLRPGERRVLVSEGLRQRFEPVPPDRPARP